MVDLTAPNAAVAASARPVLLTYNPALDGLRALAVMLVLMFHARVPGFEGGFLGVDVFFVLSGYLITTILLAEIAQTGSVNWRRFILRRIFRLAPALFALCAAFLVAAPWFWPFIANPWEEAFLTFFYLSDVTVAFLNKPELLLHSWSLSVEEHFYLVWPVILVGLCRSEERWLPFLLAALYAVATLWRIGLIGIGTEWSEVYYRLDTRLSGLMCGAWLAALLRSRLEPANRRWPLWPPLVVAAGLVITTGGWRDDFMLTGGMVIVELATAALILASQSRAGLLHASLSVAPMRLLGKWSYSLYLWNYPIFRILREHFDWPMATAIGVPLSLALAALSYATVERWGLRMRDRFGH